MRYLLTLLFFISSHSYSYDCLDACKKMSRIAKRVAKIDRLLKKNQKFYKKYSDDIGKKIKISSNILILTSKLETYNIQTKELKEEYTKQGCRRCMRIKDS